MQKTLSEIARNLDTDKTQSQGYIDNYECHFSNLRNMPVKILELGVFHGGSLLMWQEYFSKGLVVGLDLQPNPLTEMPEQVRFYRGSQDDAIFLDRVARECAPDGFDIVIDDASHIGTLSRASFRNLFEKHLKPGGIYVIEDWGTGYWGSWPDGSVYDMSHKKCVEKKTPFLYRLLKHSKVFQYPLTAHRDTDPNFQAHNFGMVGFLKELVDEVAWQDITFPDRGNSNLLRRTSMISKMTVYCGQVFLEKA
jgi:SAM-dependent methyltransferase